VAISQSHRGWRWNDSNDRLAALVNGTTRLEFRSDTTQIKPTGASGSSVTGLEVSPRFAAGVGGGDLRAILADPVLKASTGDITGQVVAVEANIDFGTSGTRTITGDVSAFSSFLAVPSTMTYSGDISFLRVRSVNVKGWDYFLNVDDANTGLAVVGATMAKDPNTDDEAGYLKILVGSTYYQMAFWASS